MLYSTHSNTPYISTISMSILLYTLSYYTKRLAFIELNSISENALGSDPLNAGLTPYKTLLLHMTAAYKETQIRACGLVGHLISTEISKLTVYIDMATCIVLHWTEYLDINIMRTIIIERLGAIDKISQFVCNNSRRVETADIFNNLPISALLLFYFIKTECNVIGLVANRPMDHQIKMDPDTLFKHTFLETSLPLTLDQFEEFYSKLICIIKEGIDKFPCLYNDINECNGYTELKIDTTDKIHASQYQLLIQYIKVHTLHNHVAVFKASNSITTEWDNNLINSCVNPVLSIITLVFTLNLSNEELCYCICCYITSILQGCLSILLYANLHYTESRTNNVDLFRAKVTFALELLHRIHTTIRSHQLKKLGTRCGINTLCAFIMHSAVVLSLLINKPDLCSNFAPVTNAGVDLVSELKIPPALSLLIKQNIPVKLLNYHCLVKSLELFQTSPHQLAIHCLSNESSKGLVSAYVTNCFVHCNMSITSNKAKPTALLSVLHALTTLHTESNVSNRNYKLTQYINSIQLFECGLTKLDNDTNTHYKEDYLNFLVNSIFHTANIPISDEMCRKLYGEIVTIREEVSEKQPELVQRTMETVTELLTYLVETHSCATGLSLVTNHSNQLFRYFTFTVPLKTGLKLYNVLTVIYQHLPFSKIGATAF